MRTSGPPSTPTESSSTVPPARGTLFALLAMALDKGGGVLVLLLIARLLGADDFGRYAALMSLLAFFQIAAEFGQEPVLVRLLAQQRGADRDARELVRGALAMRFWLAVAAGVALVSAAPFVLAAVERSALIVAACGLVASFGITLRAVFRTTQRLEALCVTASVRIGTFAAVLLIGHRLGLGFLAVIGGWALGQLAASSTAAMLLRGRELARPHWDRGVAARLARSGWPLALNAFLLTVTLRVGHLIVLNLDGPSAVGYLAAGAQLAEAFALLPEAVMLALLPILASYEVDAPEAQRALSVRTTRWFVLLALPAVIVVSIPAPRLLALLYGPEFAAGTPALRILAWLALLAATGTVFTNVMIARGLERSLLGINAVAAVLTLSLSLVLVPRFGFRGAALATLVASVASQAILLGLPSMRRDVVRCLRPLVGPVFFAGVLVALGVTLGGSSAGATVVALIVFGALVLATGVVDRSDWEGLQYAVRGLGTRKTPVDDVSKR